MKKLFYTGIFMLVSLVSFWSCQKETTSAVSVTNTETPILSKIKVQDGILKFDSYKELSDVISYLIAKQAELPTLMKEIKNFTSSNDAFEQINFKDFKSIDDILPYQNIVYIGKNANGEDVCEKVVFDPIYARLFDKKGVLFVGNEVMKVEKEDVLYVFDYQYFSTISSYRSTQDIPNVKKYSLKPKASFRVFGEKWVNYNYLNGGEDSRRKIRARNFAQTTLPGVLSTATGVSLLQTDDYKRFLGVWWCSTASIITVSSPGFGVSTGVEAYYAFLLVPTVGPGSPSVGVTSSHWAQEPYVEEARATN